MKPEIKQGDLIELGPHRLMCGDSLNWSNIKNLLRGHATQMIFTDPPYGVNYVPEDRPLISGNKELKGIKGDDDLTVFKRFLKLVSTKIVRGSVYICAGDVMINDLWTWSNKLFKRNPTLIVWDKMSFIPGGRDYHRQQELIFYNWFDGKKWVGERNQSDVWSIARRESSKYLHPTQKPLMLVRKAISNSSEPKDSVLDLFAGSGTTLIAAEQLGRISYNMELDPRYCKVIIERYIQYKNDPVIKINDEEVVWS